eukprot:1888031-Pyramimonas_sp.AAC.1
MGVRVTGVTCHSFGGVEVQIPMPPPFRVHITFAQASRSSFITLPQPHSRLGIVEGFSVFELRGSIPRGLELVSVPLARRRYELKCTVVRIIRR